jgi:GntR family transcriptional regulator
MIQVDLKSRRPIYEQVSEGFKRLIATGVLPEGEKIPSVRELASSLAVNPNTVQKAYRELESQGFIRTVPGQGSFADAPPKEPSLRLVAGLRESLEAVVRELLYQGEDPERIIEAVKGICGEMRK